MGTLSHFKKPKLVQPDATPKTTSSPLTRGISPQVIPNTQTKEKRPSTLSNIPLVRGQGLKDLGVARAMVDIIYNPSLKPRSKTMSRQMTEAEKCLWFNLLSSRQFQGYKFLKQKLIGSYILDFYCSELLLCIEVDGDTHASQTEYDQARTDFLESAGIKVIRITNQDALYNLEGVYEYLKNQIKLCRPNHSSQ